ncbi:MAG: T9SS type A sorting domain-containing protein, partial [Flavicella sp.]|nr:T9SS type A sorting domain-containing protein [Flavicella sp.]
EEEAALVKYHAYHMKQADPDIKIMFNHNNLTTGYLNQYLNEAKKKEHTGEAEDIQYIDIAETHGKWPYGGSPDINQYPAATFSEWQTEYPLRDRKNRQREWRNELVALRAEAVATGNPDLLFANNEYGHGKGNRALNFDKYSKSLLVIDMLQEHFIGNWYMTCYWSQIKTTQSEDTSFATNKNFDYQLNAMHFGFELLAEALEGTMLTLEDPVIDAEVAALAEGTYAANSVYGFVSKKENKYLVYVLNKASQSKKIQLNFNNTNGLNLKLSKAESMVNTTDELGEIIELTGTEINSNKFNIDLPSLSYTKLTYIDEDTLSLHNITPSELWKITVYPNPSKNLIFVDSNFPTDSYWLYDMQGQLLKKNVFSHDKIINLENLDSGTYFLKIQNKEYQQKIVKIVKE